MQSTSSVCLIIRKSCAQVQHRQSTMPVSYTHLDVYKRQVKTSDPVQIGSYRGYAMSVEFSAWKQEYTLLLKGQMTHRATLGTDPVSYTHLDVYKRQV